MFIFMESNIIIASEQRYGCLSGSVELRHKVKGQDSIRMEE